MPDTPPTEDPNKNYPPPPWRNTDGSHRPMGPHGLPWGSGMRWVARGASSLGRGIEMAAAGALITGAAITLYAGGPPLLAAWKAPASCQHEAVAPSGTPAATPLRTGEPRALVGIEKIDKKGAAAVALEQGKGGVAAAS